VILLVVSEGQCEICDELAPLLAGLCSECWETDGAGPLSAWMVRVLFAIEAARTPAAWREYLDAAKARRGSEDHVTGLSLVGPPWAREIIEAVS